MKSCFRECRMLCIWMCVINSSLYRVLQTEWTGVTCRKETSSAPSSCSMALICSERDDISSVIFSIFSFIVWLFCSSSSLSAEILAASSSFRNCWSFSNSIFICVSVCWAWLWNKHYSPSFQHNPELHSQHCDLKASVQYLDVLCCLITD